MSISLEEWVKAVQEAEIQASDGYTSHEIAKAMGYKNDYFRHRVKPRLIAEGKLKISGKKTIRDNTGRVQRVQVYELIPISPTKKEKTAPSVGLRTLGSLRRRRG